MMGRLYSVKDFEESDMTEAVTYYKKAIELFTKIDHYRGMYMGEKDLHDF
jgi:hypothetical protein